MRLMKMRTGKHVSEIIAKPEREEARSSHHCATIARSLHFGRDGLCPVHFREGFAIAASYWVCRLLVGGVLFFSLSAVAIPPETVPCVESLLGRALTAEEKGFAPRRVWSILENHDELLADWLSQDAKLKPGELFFEGDCRKRVSDAFAVHKLPPFDPANAAESLLRYRQACLARREARLRHVPRQWVYARHYIMGGSHYAYTEALSDAQSERTYFSVGSQLCLAEYAANGCWNETVLLHSDTGTFRDADVSPDGKRVLYSYKAHDRNDDFHLYELTVENRETRQLTFGAGVADYEGCYLPDGRILFNSTRCMQIVDCWWTEVSNLYRCESDGSKIIRLTFDQVHDNYPAVTEDGRVLYTRWEYNDRSQMFPQPLFQMAADGTSQQAFYGGNSWFPTTLIHARQVPGSPLCFGIATGHHSFQPGELVRINPQEGREEADGCWQMEPLRKAKAVRIDEYGQTGRIAAYPYPVNENEVVLSFLPEGWFRSKEGRPEFRYHFARMGLYWTNVDGERELLVARRDHKPCGRPVPLQPRQFTPQRLSQVDWSKRTGTFYVQDVYRGESMRGIPRGMVKTLRVVELKYRHVGIGETANWGDGGGGLSCSPPSTGIGSWSVKVPHGDARVYEDGSVFFTADARRPLFFMLLDEKGRMVQSMRSWVTIQPGENASCVGCHESRNSAPVSELQPTLAMRAGPETLRPVLDPPRGFSFTREIQPILDARCVSCHAPGKTAHSDLTAMPVDDKKAKRRWLRSYLTLTHSHRPNENDFFRGDPKHPVLNWISSGSAPTPLPPLSFGSSKSKLFEMLDKGHAPGVTDAEKRKLALWVDLGVPFCGDYLEANIWSEGERRRSDYTLEKRKRADAEDAANVCR